MALARVPRGGRDPRATFAAATEGIDARFQDLNRGAEEDMVPRFVDYSRHFDLIVLGQRQPDNSLMPPDLNEQIIVQTGRPVLVTPYGGGFSGVGARPIFASTRIRAAAPAPSAMPRNCSSPTRRR